MSEWTWFHVDNSRLSDNILCPPCVALVTGPCLISSTEALSRETLIIVPRSILSHPNTPIVFRPLPAGVSQDTFHVIYNNLACLHVIFTIISSLAIFIMDQFSWIL